MVHDRAIVTIEH